MMHEVRVYNALGKLKKVIPLKELQKRSDKVLSDPNFFKPKGNGLANYSILNKS